MPDKPARKPAKPPVTKATKPAKGKHAAPKKAAKPGKDGPGAARVRMYRHGLGDCFLLSFPRAGTRDFRVLIDCGIIQGTPGMTGAVIDGAALPSPLPEDQDDVLALVVADLKKATDENGTPTVDVLVATHEHWDHLAGFAQYTTDFDGFDFKEVWLAWTEDPKDPTATRLRRERAEKVDALQRGIAHARAAMGLLPMGAKQPDETAQRAADELDRAAEVLSFFGVDPTAQPGNANSGLGITKDGDELFGVAGKPRLSVSEAMGWCRKHKGVRFYTPGALIDLGDEVEGLRVYVLGPPTDLRQLTKDLPTKKGRETYEEEHHLAVASRAFFGARAGEHEGPSREIQFERSAPFDTKYRIKMETAAANEFYRTHYFGTGSGASEDWRRIDEAGLAGASAFALALDSDTNNTSLALAFELGEPGGGRVLLFPGDAQVGNWESWHADSDGKPLTWKVETSENEELTVTAADLLARTVVYKVGHHGSHNATLRGKGLELMTHPDLIALVPVDVYVAHEKKCWGKMPFEPLIQALHVRALGRVILADQTIADLKPDSPFPGKLEDSADVITVEGEGKKPVTRPLWVEYTVPEAGA